MNKFDSWVEYRIHLFPVLSSSRTDIRRLFLHKRDRRVVNREVPIPPQSKIPIFSPIIILINNPSLRDSRNCSMRTHFPGQKRSRPTGGNHKGHRNSHLQWYFGYEPRLQTKYHENSSRQTHWIKKRNYLSFLQRKYLFLAI